MAEIDDIIAEALSHHQAGALDRAAQLYQAALRLDPAHADANNLLGALHLQYGDPAVARDHFRRAAAARPDIGFFHLNLGKAHEALGEPAEALACFRAAVAASPGLAEAQNDLGNALLAAGEFAGALIAFDAAVVARPDYPLALFNRGNLRADFGDHAAAIADYRAAVALQPGYADAWANLGTALGLAERTAEAVEALGQAVAAAPDHSHALDKLAWLAAQTCDWPLLAATLARLAPLTAAELAAGRPVGEVPMNAVAFHPDDAHGLAVAAACSAALMVRAGAPAQLPSLPSADGRIRLGYLSADYRDHATAHLLGDLFRRHDRGGFHVTAYSHGPADEGFYRNRIRGQADRFVDLEGLGDREAAARIAADGIDIFIDLKGHTSGNRLAILALRPAPVQVSWLGFPGSTGARFVDYLIADGVVVPPGHDIHCSEAVARLPHAYQLTDDAQPIDPRLPTRPELGLPAEGVVFACFNQNYKIEPVAFAAWMRILGRVPGSVLWLLRNNEAGCARLQAAAAAAGIDPARLVFAPKLAKSHHLARLQQADLVLDTRIYNGHTTTTDALWAGVPVVAMRGAHFASRVSESLLEAVGLPELVATDLAGYEALAVDLAGAPDRLAALKARLRAARHDTALFDSGRFVRALEDLYRQMWALHRAGERPRTLDADDPPPSLTPTPGAPTVRASFGWLGG